MYNIYISLKLPWTIASILPWEEIKRERRGEIGVWFGRWCTVEARRERYQRAGRRQLARVYTTALCSQRPRGEQSPRDDVNVSICLNTSFILSLILSHLVSLPFHKDHTIPLLPPQPSNAYNDPRQSSRTSANQRASYIFFFFCVWWLIFKCDQLPRSSYSLTTILYLYFFFTLSLLVSRVLWKDEYSVLSLGTYLYKCIYT